MSRGNGEGRIGPEVPGDRWLGAAIGSVLLLAVAALPEGAGDVHIRRRGTTTSPSDTHPRPPRPGASTPMKLFFPALSVLTAAAVAIPACGGDPPPPDDTSGDGQASLAAGLCAAAAAARSGDQQAARRLFFDRAHQPIHQLAAATSEVDRAAAAKLLEAKQAVEDDLNDPGAAGLADHLAALAAAAAVAADGDDGTRPAACTAP